MSEQYTDTGRTLIPEGNYEAMITNVTKKEPKGFIMYDWRFESLKDNKPFYFNITLFSSQMAELLRALGAEEVTQNRFKWDDVAVVGNTVSFNLIHLADKKGIIRETLSDIKLLTSKNNNPGGITDPKDIQWQD